MGYGGFVAGWTAPLGSAVRVGARGLFGMGQARLTGDVPYCNSDCFGWDHMHGGPPGSGFTVVRRVIFDQHFIVFEPQATAVIRLGSKVALDMLSLIHISEPTRLGMISYAVFCLKKK